MTAIQCLLPLNDHGDVTRQCEYSPLGQARGFSRTNNNTVSDGTGEHNEMILLLRIEMISFMPRRCLEIRKKSNFWNYQPILIAIHTHARSIITKSVYQSILHRKGNGADTRWHSAVQGRLSSLPLSTSSQCRLRLQLSCGGASSTMMRALRVLSAKKVIKDRKSTRLNSSHSGESRMPSSA